MKFRQILFVLLSIMCFSTISAQQLTPKKQQKFAERVNLTAFAGNTLCDKTYIENIDWMEYLFWLEKTYGKDSEQYRSAIPDPAAARALMPDSIAREYDVEQIHPIYMTRPVLGVSPAQAAAYCRWRTDRVAEAMLVQQQKVRTFQFTTDTNIFTLDNYVAPEGVQFLRFFVPADMDTRYGFYCFAVWK